MAKNATTSAILVGHILKPVGLGGEVRVEVASDVPQRFAPGALLYIEGTAYHVEGARPMRRGLVVKLAEVGSLAQAEALRGEALYIEEAQVPPPPEDTYYYFQVLGMEVYTREGEYLGEVKEILATGSNDVYVLWKGPREVLVPAIDGVVVEMDINAGRMTVDLPEGL